VQESANFGPVFSVPQKTLKDLLGQVSFAMAVQDIRYYLNGILFVAEGKTAEPGGHRRPPPGLCQRHAGCGSAQAGSHPAAQDRDRTAAPAVRDAGGDNQPHIEMQFANNQAKFSFGGMEFVTKLVEGKFPDYNRVIPKNHQNSVTLGRAPLLASLQRTAIMTSDKFKGVRLNIEPGTLRVASPTTPSRKRRWTSSTSTTAATPSRSASTSPTSSTPWPTWARTWCKIDLADGNSSALMTIPDNATFKYVVMPMRI
jgi:DNA polymerase-3 subunit beta